MIARYASENSFDTVLSPSHFLGDPKFEDRLQIDRRSCEKLRTALDREGGKYIVTDYPVIVSTAMLADRSKWGQVVASLSDMPIGNAWLRISGQKSEAGPSTRKRHLEALISCQGSGVPIVADYAGGLTGLAALALGAASGIAGGLGERERFDASRWYQPPPDEKEAVSSGRKPRVAMPGFLGSLTCEELSVLASAKGGRKPCACADRACCPHGYDDMLEDPRGHGARQQAKAVSALQKVSDLRRASHFLEGSLAEAERHSHNLGQLRPSQITAEQNGIDRVKFMHRMQKARTGSEVGKVLRRMDEQRGGEWTRARPIARHQSPGPLFRRGRP